MPPIPNPPTFTTASSIPLELTKGESLEVTGRGSEVVGRGLLCRQASERTCM